MYPVIFCRTVTYRTIGYRLVLFITTCCIAGSATADIYKCHRGDGTVQFSDKVCTDGNSEVIQLQENTAMDSKGYRDSGTDIYINSAKSNVVSSAQRQHIEPHVLILRDDATEERNARVRSEAPHRMKLVQHKKKRKNKSKNK